MRLMSACARAALVLGVLWSAGGVAAQVLTPLGKAEGQAILTQIQSKPDEKVTVIGQRGLPAEAFGVLPSIASADISPSGDKVAMVVNEGRNTRIVVIDTKTRALLGTVGAPAELSAFGIKFRTRIAGINWISDDRYLVIAALIGKFGSGDDDVATICRMIATNVDGSQSIGILPENPGSAPRGSNCNVTSIKGAGPDEILVSAFTGDVSGSGIASRSRAAIDVWSVNHKTGRGRIVEKGNGKTAAFGADRNGKIRLRVDVTQKTQEVFARQEGSDEWKLVYTGRQRTFDENDKPRGDGLSFQGFGDDPNIAYVTTRVGDKNAIGTFNIATGQQGAAVLSDSRFDAGGVKELRNGRIIGASINREYPQQEFFASDWKNLQRVIGESFPGDRILILSSSDDLTKHVLYSEGPNAYSGEYLFLDLTAGDVKNIGYVYPAIKSQGIQFPKFVTYTARDGTQIPAYLLMPPGATGKNMAAVVFPHGGPQARDQGDFDWFTGFVASRGYAVLLPQYRGSDGFGENWIKAGEKQWGLRMQDDVSDGVKYLVDQGIADPKRICIAGWSYGGYAASAGATLTPDLYRCAISGAGVHDLMEMLNYVEGNEGAFRYWKNHIGNPSTDRAKIEAASPVRHVANIKAPFMLIHGQIDTVVPLKQSQIMADALKAAGKTHELVVLPNETHNMSFVATRIQTLKAMEQFLLTHNPP